MPTEKIMSKTRRNLTTNSLSYQQRDFTYKIELKRNSENLQKSSGLYTLQK